MIRVRTGYSFRTAVGALEAVAARLKQINAPVWPITDRASTFGFTRWNKLAGKSGKRPLFGVELAVTPSINEKKPTVDYWTFLAKQDIAEVNRLVQLATSQFRYEPLLTYEQALQSDTLRLVGGRARVELIPKEHPGTYAALAPSSVPYHIKALAERLPCVAASDNFYPTQGDQHLYEIVCGRGASLHTWKQWLLSDEEWLEALGLGQYTRKTLKHALDHRSLVYTQSTAQLRGGTLLNPHSNTSLLALCQAGAAELGCDLTDPVYAARLMKELGLIEQKQFANYFFIISDMMRWARANMTCGPARGSSCGSLVCYLLRITAVDPIPYGLIFERFIDTTRADLPDIDLDFNDVKRDMVFKYMEDKYGRNHVARLGTVSLYKPRSALGEACGALGLPPYIAEPTLDSLLQRSSGDARALQSLQDSFDETDAGRKLIAAHPELRIAQQMEGHPRHYSQHAAGLVLTEQPVSQFVAVDARTGATMCDKKDAEDLNLLKIDALGLTQLSVFEDTLKALGLPHDYLDSIPLDDDAAFQVLRDHNFAGIFQFNGIALQSLTKQIKVDSLNDIVSITALARPGPLTGGGATQWVARRNGARIEYPHPVFEPYLRDTLGVVVYQEQVMEIGRHVGALSWDDVTALRKAMSKSLGKEYFDQYGDRFKVGAVMNGVPREVLDKIWDSLCAYGSWAFNKSHSVAYGLVSYYCCWLKAHHPTEFAAATLSHEFDPNKQIQTLREMAAEGIKYIPVDAAQSTDKWISGQVNGEPMLIGPVSNVRGIGPKIIQQIVSARARGEPLPERASKLLANPITSIDSLYPIKDAVRKVCPDPAARNILSAPTTIENVNGAEDGILVYCRLAKINPRDENEAVNVAKRGGKIIVGEPTASLNLQIEDDSGIMLAKITRWDYERLGREIVERGGVRKALYALKGNVFNPGSFRMLMVKGARYLGDM